jgi:hypothetical protein
LLVDFGLVLNGFRTVAKAQRRNRFHRVVTAGAATDDQHRARVSPQRFLQQPVVANEITEVVEKVVEKKSSKKSRRTSRVAVNIKT